MPPERQHTDLKPARADVSRNRQKILGAARRMFAEAAVEDVQLDDIAVAAGVGRTTLFRHVGSKGELVHEIYRERVSQALETVKVALAYEDAYEGLAFMIRSLAGWLNEDRSLIDYSRRMEGRVETLDTTLAIEAAVAPVLDRAWAAGVLWADVRPHDILALISFALQDPPEGDEPRWYLYTELLLRGLRASRPAADD